MLCPRPYKCRAKGRFGGRPTGFPPDALSLQSVYKPGSGWHAGKPAYVTAIHLGRRLPAASSNLPERQDLDRSRSLRLAPFLFGLAPGGVCRAAGVAANAVRSYRTVSPLPRQIHNAPRRSVLCGTFPGLAPAGCYPAPFVHGARTFPPRQPFGFAGAAVRPTDRNTDGGANRCRQEASFCDAITSGSKLMTRAAMFRGLLRWVSRSFSVRRVEMSQTPSTRSGRK
jgi:hypothetical protein